MGQLHSLGGLRELSLIVVREALSALPYEFTLDGSAEIRRHGRDEDQVAGAVHGRIEGVACAAAIAGLQSLGCLADADRTAPSVGLDVDAGCLRELRPRFGEFRESVPMEFHWIPAQCDGEQVYSIEGFFTLLDILCIPRTDSVVNDKVCLVGSIHEGNTSRINNKRCSKEGV